MNDGQKSFERLRLLVILHGTQEDVDALHDLKDRFNKLCSLASWRAPVEDAALAILGEE